MTAKGGGYYAALRVQRSADDEHSDKSLCGRSPRRDGGGGGDGAIGGRPQRGGHNGSQAFRILGGVLAPDNQLPVQIVGHVEDAGEHRVVYLHVEEAMGVGLMHGMEGKYRHHCQNVLAQLRSQLSERLSAVSHIKALAEYFHVSPAVFID